MSTRIFDEALAKGKKGLTQTQQKILLSALRHGGLFSVTMSNRLGGRVTDAAMGLVELGLLDRVGKPERESETGYSRSRIKRHYLTLKFRLTASGKNWKP